MSEPQSGMSKSRYAIYALPLVFFLGMAWLFFGQIGKDPTELPSARLGQEMPAFQLSSLTEPNRVLTVADVKGEVSVLNVWATWCVSCLIEHPVLNQMAADGVRIVGVNYKDYREAAQQYLVNKKDPFVFSIFDEDGSLAIDLGVYGAPETYLLDADGRIRYRFIGVLDEPSWINVVKPRYEALKAGLTIPEDGR